VKARRTSKSKYVADLRQTLLAQMDEDTIVNVEF
jgi:hypothetical protein